MRDRIVRQGDSVRRAHTARVHNEFLRAADALNFTQDHPRQFDNVVISERAALTALVENQLATNALLKHIRSIVTPRILPAENQDEFDNRMVMRGDTPQQGAFGVMLEASQQNDAAKAAVSGLVSCKLFVPADGDWIKRADVDKTDDTRLLAKPNGSAQIIWKAAGTNTTVDAIVRLGNPEFVAVKGKAVGAIAAGSNDGVMEVYIPGSTQTGYTIGTGEDLDEAIHLDWMHRGEGISDGKEIWIGWFHDELLWRVLGAECEDDPKERATGQISDGPATVGNTQLITTTPAAWDIFDPANDLNTPNVIPQAANSAIQLPDVTDAQGDVYSYSYTGVLTPGSNNNTYVIDGLLNGTPVGSPLLIDGRQSGTSLSFSFSGLVIIPQGSAPTVGLQISTLSGSDTITWNGANLTLDRDTDF